MERDNFESTILVLKRRKPFVPFTISMANGDRHEIDYPEALALRGGFGMFVSPGGIPVFLDHEGVTQVIGDLTENSST